MTPPEHASDEIALWQQALREQRKVEEELDVARQKRRAMRVIELMPVVQALRTRADLLLAEAVKVKWSLTAAKESITDWDNPTQPGALQDDMCHSTRPQPPSGRA